MTGKIALFLVLASFFCSCNKKTKKQEEKQAQVQVLKINNQGDYASIHPHTGIDLQCRILQKALFEGLMRVGLSGEPELAAAEKIEISPCQTFYTFHLRPMQWTNGEKVTSSHFVRAWKKALDPHSNCLRADLFYAIKNGEKVKKRELPLEELGITIKDESTFQVELEHPAPYFLDLVANPLFSPIYDEKDVPTVFNGPFKIAEWIHDKHLLLEKNPDYWDARSVPLDKINISFVNDANTALLMYEKKELDWIGHPFTMLPQDALQKMENSPDYNAKPIAGIYWICLNTKFSPLTSPNIRKALSIALNRKDIASQVLVGETPTRSIIPIGLSLLKEDEFYPDGDAKTALQFFYQGLEELQLTLADFPKLKLSYSDIPGQKKLAEAIQEKWNQVLGIEVELVGSEWNVFFSDLGQKQLQMGGCIWFCAFYDPIYTLEFFKDFSHRYNSPSWENPRFQHLLELSDHECDPSIRKMHLKQAELLLLDEMPVIPLFVFNSKYLKTKNLKNLIVNDLGHADFKWAYFE